MMAQTERTASTKLLIGNPAPILEVIAISGDTLERAKQFKEKANIQNVTIDYGLTPDEMRR